MLIFVAALQSPEVSRDWNRICQLCRRSVRSMLAQTEANIRVYLVVHVKPPGLPSDPRLVVIECPGLPVPGDPASRMLDKWTKLKIALIEVRSLAPCHVMICDADDCVHRGLSTSVCCQPDCAGWYFDYGYFHDEGSRWLMRYGPRFDVKCGTSAIVRCETTELPDSLDACAKAFPLLAHGHGAIRDFMDTRRTPLRALPYAGAVYVLATGENDSGFSLRGWRSRRLMFRKLLNTRPLTPRTRAAYQLFPLEP